MKKSAFVWWPTALALVLPLQSARAQTRPTSGLYQIVSGRFVTCCGFGGELTRPVPYAEQGFVQLTVDAQANRAQMTLLGQDMATVFQIRGMVPSQETFTYNLTNGSITPGQIQFGDPTWPPNPDQLWMNYIISNSADALRINGTVITPCPGCADVFTEFTHTNVVAVLMPTAAVRVSEVEVCWNAISNTTYQAQYQSALTTNAWINFGPPVTGNGAIRCVIDKVPSGEPQRYYRVVIVP